MKCSILGSAIFGASIVLARVATPGVNVRIDAGPVKLVDLTYIGPITPGGENYTLVAADAKGIYEQIIELNPSYNIDDFNLPTSPVASQLIERSPVRLVCDVEERAYGDAIRDGINYLKSLGAGLCHIGPKPNCGRISCSYHSAIYLCNDNSFEVAPAFNYLGYRMAQNILDQCAVHSAPNDLVSGQIWDQDNYNIIVGLSNNFGEGGC